MDKQKKIQKKEKLNYKGCRLLAIGVIKSAIREYDSAFFSSDTYNYIYSPLAYGCKSDCKEGKEIAFEVELEKLNQVKQDMRKENGGKKSKWF